jgi:hypothetical protein
MRTAERVAESHAVYMQQAMRAAEFRTNTMGMLLPSSKRQWMATQEKFNAADVAEEALNKARSVVYLTLVPIRPRRRGERRSLRRTFSPGVSLRPSPLPFDPDTPRHPPFNSTPDAPFNSTPTL